MPEYEGQTLPDRRHAEYKALMAGAGKAIQGGDQFLVGKTRFRRKGTSNSEDLAPIRTEIAEDGAGPADTNRAGFRAIVSCTPWASMASMRHCNRKSKPDLILHFSLAECWPSVYSIDSISSADLLTVGDA